MSILIVEDDIISAESLKANLTDYGFQVDYAISELIAIKMIQKQLPDIILLDINLNSSNDGIFIAEKALKIRPQIKIIFVTGYSEKSYSDRLKDIDFVAYLEKPLGFAQLLDILKSMQ